MQYPKQQIEFLQAVQDMRDAQREYFRQPGEYKLKVSKVREQKVDALLKPYLIEGAIRQAVKPKDNQTSMFS